MFLPRAAVAALLAAGLAGCGDSSVESSPLYALCQKDLVEKRGKPADVAKTECSCTIGMLRDKLEDKEFKAFEMVVPMMEKSPAGPTPEMMTELTTATGFTMEQFSAVGQKATGIAEEAQKTCAK